MTWVTRCPGCRTAFRVTEAQLEARSGKVCCGRCGRVFDALATIVEPLGNHAKSPPARAVPRETLVTAVAAIGARTGVRADSRQAGIDEPWRDDRHVSREDETQRDRDRVETRRDETREVETHANGTPLDVPAAAEPDPALSSGDIEAAAPESPPDEDEVEFGPPQRRARSWWWWPACAVLLAALAAQGAFHYRGELALIFPGAKPLIEQLCAELGCDVPLPRHAELMSIESSDLQADGSNPSVMVLSATLRNRAVFAQSLPALELTLTNAQEQLVARRVLMPQDYTARGTNLAAGLAGNSELPFKVFIEAAALKATGYRLYLFYP